jgi:predicted nucleic acid-binding protein
MIVIDASAALEALLPTPRAPRIWTRILDPGETVHAPHLIDLEVAQVLRRHARAGQLSEHRCQAALNNWKDVTLVRHPHEDLLPRIWALRASLTAYDAAYVALAEVLSAPLLTHDIRLTGSHGHNAVIEFV